MTVYYVVRTIAGREFEAAKALREQAYMSSYVPWIERPAKRGFKQAAYFPGYMFVRNWIPWDQCNPKHERCVRDKRGNPLLVGPVGIGGVCYPIPEEELSGIAIRAAMQRLDGESDPEKAQIKAGDIGIMKSGPFEGHQGEVVAVRGDEAEIALQIFNAIRLVKAPTKSLEAA